MRSWLLALLPLIACGPKDPTDTTADETDADTDTDTDADTDSDTDTDTDSDTDTDTDTDADADTGTTETGATDTGTPGPSGLAVLGWGSHDVTQVVISEVLTSADGLADPTDLSFHPDDPTQVWITNQANDSVLVVDDAFGAPVVDRRHGSSSDHFMPRPASFAFGAPGFMATIHEEDQRTQLTTPPEFMGPTLWPSDDAQFDGDHPSHLDMLHNSPNGVGIAWEVDNAYWVFDGFHNSLTRYDFAQPHVPGGTDHSDGSIVRAVEGEVAYVPDCVSHLAWDASSGLLYVADSGHARIAVLDPSTGTLGRAYTPNFDGIAVQNRWDGATLTTLVDGAPIGLQTPAGLELVDGVLWVTDAATSTIWAFDLQGNPIDWLALGRGPGLQGITVDRDGNGWVVDKATDTLLKIAPL